MKIKAWAIIRDDSIFMSRENGEKKFWLRCVRTLKQAKKTYPKDRIVRVLITY